MIDAARPYLPGMYRNLRPLQGESFQGYILRLAETNGYSGVRDVLQVVNQRRLSNKLGRCVRAIRSDGDALSTLARIAFGQPDGLVDYLVQPLGETESGDTPAVIAEGCRIDNDAVMHDYAQVCPICLGERGVVLSAWDYAPTVACTLHHVMLVDFCEACRSRLSWSRSHLMNCGNCGADMREVKASPVPATWLDAVLDFEAFAPFRFFLRDGRPEVVSWDAAFRVLKLLSLDGPHWWAKHWPESAPYFAELTIEERAKAIERLATARGRAGYELQRLQPFLMANLQHLTAIDSENLCEENVFRFALEGAGLYPVELAESLSYQSGRPNLPSGAELFGGRPPMLRSDLDVAHFLGADAKTVKRLYAIERLHWPKGEQIGHDIDEVLRARRFLEHDLLSIERIRDLVGVPLDWDEIARNPILAKWNPQVLEDQRVQLDFVVTTQQRIRMAVNSLPKPKDGIRFDRRALQTARPLPFVLGGVQRLLNGGFRAADWDTPYTWGCVIVEKAEADFLAMEFEASVANGPDGSSPQPGDYLTS